MDELFKEMTKDFSFLKEENFPSWCKIKKKCKNCDNNCSECATRFIAHLYADAYETKITPFKNNQEQWYEDNKRMQKALFYLRCYTPSKQDKRFEEIKNIILELAKYYELNKEEENMGEIKNLVNKKKEKSFIKSDLKNGDIVELRNGERYVYIEKYINWNAYTLTPHEVIVSLENGINKRLDGYNDDLRYEDRDNCKYDIMKILDMSELHKNPTWTLERSKTEMTLEEVCKELGRDIKIVKEH